MKRWLSLLIGLLFLVPFQTASAHLAGQPPFFKVDGVYSNLYSVPTTSIEDFSLPQDMTPGTYLVNKKINFEIDTVPLPVPQDIVAKSEFDWDFGDGTKTTGLKNTHTYNKIGSYLITINVKSPDSSQPTLLESALINILPDAHYQLPKAVIKINGRQSKDPLTDVITLPFSQPIQIDGSASNSTSPITSYFIDFGDGKGSDKPQETHQYSQQIHQYFPLVRIKTADGFIADNFVEIEDGNVATTSPAQPTPTSKPINLPLLIIAGLPILAIVGGLVYKKAKH